MAVTVGGVKVDLIANSANFTRGIMSAASSLRGFQASAARSTVGGLQFGMALGGTMNAISRVMGGVQSLIDIPKGAVSLAADAEDAQIAFETFLKSGSLARDLLADIQKFAVDTPFQTPELRDAAKQLLAFGVPAEKLMPTLKTLGEISSSISTPIGELAAVFGKARVQGRAYQKDINELTNRGVDVLPSLRQQLGVSAQDLPAAIEKGRVSFGHIAKAFTDITTGEGRYAGGMEKKSKGLTGLWSTFQDNIGVTQRTFGESLVQAFDLKGLTRDLIAFTESLRMNADQWYMPIAQGAELFRTFGQTTSAYFGLIATDSYNAFSQLASATGLATVGFNDVNEAISRATERWLLFKATAQWQVGEQFGRAVQKDSGFISGTWNAGVGGIRGLVDKARGLGMDGPLGSLLDKITPGTISAESLSEKGALAEAVAHSKFANEEAKIKAAFDGVGRTSKDKGFVGPIQQPDWMGRSIYDKADFDSAKKDKDKKTRSGSKKFELEAAVYGSKEAISAISRHQRGDALGHEDILRQQKAEQMKAVELLREIAKAIPSLNTVTAQF